MASHQTAVRKPPFLSNPRVLQTSIFGNTLKNIVIEKSVYYKIDFPDSGSSATPSLEGHPLRQRVLQNFP